MQVTEHLKFTFVMNSVEEYIIFKLPLIEKVPILVYKSLLYVSPIDIIFLHLLHLNYPEICLAK